MSLELPTYLDLTCRTSLENLKINFQAPVAKVFSFQNSHSFTSKAPPRHSGSASLIDFNPDQLSRINNPIIDGAGHPVHTGGRTLLWKQNSSFVYEMLGPRGSVSELHNFPP